MALVASIPSVIAVGLAAFLICPPTFAPTCSFFWDDAPNVFWRIYYAEPGEPWALLTTSVVPCADPLEPYGQLIFYDVKAVDWTTYEESPAEHGECGGECA